MSSKKKKKELEPEVAEKPPLMERPKFKMFYTFAVITFFGLGIILLILSMTIWSEIGYLLFISLGILGVGIVLLTMRSSYSTSAQEKKQEEEKDPDSLQMRTRR